MAFHRMTMDADVEHVLPSVRVPTLVLFSSEQRGPAEFFARHIAGAELQELPTMRGEYTWVDDETHEATMGSVKAFVGGLQRREQPDRILSTVLFTDIVGSTQVQASLGDRSWRDLVERHHAIVRSALGRWRGVENDRRATASTRRSTGRRARSRAASRWSNASASSASRSALACTPASAR
jgi:hypothetical protein